MVVIVNAPALPAVKVVLAALVIAGGRLTVSNTTVRNNTSTGLLSNPSSGSTKIDVALDNVIAEGNGTGITAAGGGAMTIKRSAVSNNLGNGLDAEGAATTMAADNCMISNNGAAGLFTAASGTLRVSNSDVANNTSAANGAWTSFGNNRITGAAGTARSPQRFAGTTV